MKMADFVRNLARDRGVTPAQAALGWILAQKEWIVPIPGTKRTDRLRENIGSSDVLFTEKELNGIRAELDRIEVYGAQYPETQARMTNR